MGYFMVHEQPRRDEDYANSNPNQSPPLHHVGQLVDFSNSQNGERKVYSNLQPLTKRFENMKLMILFVLFLLFFAYMFVVYFYNIFIASFYQLTHVL